MGLAGVSPGLWLQMLCTVMEQVPHAMLVVDMCVPGLPITYCNAAMAQLTAAVEAATTRADLEELYAPYKYAPLSVRWLPRVGVICCGWRAAVAGAGAQHTTMPAHT